jgi:hypothetical protein
MTYNFKDHTKGDTFISPLFEVKINGTAVDLTDYSIRMQVRRSAAKTSAVVMEFSTVYDTIEIVDNKFKLKEGIIDVPVNSYVFDIEFTNTVTDVVKTWVKGTWKITEEVTQ